MQTIINQIHKTRTSSFLFIVHSLIGPILQSVKKVGSLLLIIFRKLGTTPHTRSTMLILFQLHSAVSGVKLNLELPYHSHEFYHEKYNNNIKDRLKTYLKIVIYKVQYIVFS